MANEKKLKKSFSKMLETLFEDFEEEIVDKITKVDKKIKEIEENIQNYVKVKISDDIKNITKEFNEKIEKLQENYNQLQSTNNKKLTEKIDQLEKEKKELEEKHKNLEITKTELNTKIGNLTQNLKQESGYKTKYEEVNKNYNELKTKIEEIQKSKDNLEKEKKELEETNKRLQDDLKSKKEKLAECENQKNDLSPLLDYKKVFEEDDKLMDLLDSLLKNPTLKEYKEKNEITDKTPKSIKNLLLKLSTPQIFINSYYEDLVKYKKENPTIMSDEEVRFYNAINNYFGDEIIIYPSTKTTDKSFSRSLHRGIDGETSGEIDNGIILIPADKIDNEKIKVKLK